MLRLEGDGEEKEAGKVAQTEISLSKERSSCGREHGAFRKLAHHWGKGHGEGETEETFKVQVWRSLVYQMRGPWED